MTEIDQVLQQVVNDIWVLYDKDNNGYLDKTEAKKFIFNVVGSTEAAAFEENEFDECFDELDINGTGVIERAEMVSFIKALTRQDEDSD